MSKLTLTDDAGNTEEIALPEDVTVTIKPPAPPTPVPPKASFTVKMDGLTANIVDTSKPGSSPLKKVSYTFAGDGQVSSAPGAEIQHTFPNASQRNIVQTVTDENGLTATDSKIVYPTQPPAPGAPPPPSNPPPANKPPDPPAAPPPPKAAFTATVDGNVVTVHDQTTGATSESIDFGDGTVMDDTQQ